MASIVVRFDNQSIECNEFDEVKQAIFNLGAASGHKYPMGDINYSDDIVLNIGLAEPYYWIHYTKGSSQDFFLPKTNRDEKCEINFIYDGQLTPMKLKHCVDMETFLAVIRQFVKDGELPSIIDWKSI